MKIFIHRNKLTDVILSPQQGAVPKDCRLCSYVQQVVVGNGILYYHLMTGELLLSDDAEADRDYLFRHYFLVKPDHDDYKLYQSFFSFYQTLTLQHAKNVNSYTILTTTDCNARCFYCYELGSKQENMREETADLAVEYIKANADRTKPVQLSWFGGEPLYHASAIDQICAELKEEGIDYSSSMISNGYLFDEELVQKASDLWKLKKVQITLDGTEEVYNKRKAYIYKDGTSAFRKVLQNIRFLAKVGIEVNIRLNLDAKNQQDLLKLLDELNTVFHPYEERHGWSDHIQVYCHELFQCSEDEGISDLKKVIDQKIKDCNFFKKKYVSLGMKTNYCMADSPESVIIMPDGSLHACEHFNVQTSFGSILKNNQKKSVIPYYRERLTEERCRSCPVLPQCIRLKHCPNGKRTCSDAEAAQKLKSIRESMLHYEKEYRIFKIKVAGFVFEIVPFNKKMIRFFTDYLTEEAPVHTIAVTAKDIDYEREQAKKAAELEGHPYGNFSDCYLEFISISRLISDYLSFHQCFLFHGALIEKEGRGYLFTAKSGTGKTTHIMNWQKVFDDVMVVNGDKPFLKVEEDGVYAYGTPWCGKENLNINKSVRLDNLVILERDERNHIERVRYTDYMNQLFTRIYIPKDEGGMGRAFQMIHELSDQVKLYRLGCNMDPESALVSYNGMKE